MECNDFFVSGQCIHTNYYIRVGVGRVATVRSNNSPRAKSLHPHPQPVNFGLDGAHQLIDLLDPLQEEVHPGLGGGLLRRVLVVHRHDRPGQPVANDAELRAVDAVPEVAVGALVGQVVLDGVGTENRRPPAEVAVDARQVLGGQRDELVRHGLLGRVGVEASPTQHHEVVVALGERADRQLQLGNERVLLRFRPHDRLAGRDDVVRVAQGFTPGVPHAGEFLGEDLSAEPLHLLDVLGRRAAVDGDGGVAVRDSRLNGLERAVGANRLGIAVVGCERRGRDDGLTHFVLPSSGWVLLTLVVPRYNNTFLPITQYLVQIVRPIFLRKIGTSHLLRKCEVSYSGSSLLPNLLCQQTGLFQLLHCREPHPWLPRILILPIPSVCDKLSSPALGVNKVTRPGANE